TDELFFDMKLNGLIPVIVHPERNQEIIDHPMRLYKLIRKGALSQITAGSLLCRFGKRAQNSAHGLIQHNLTHLIASDAHNTMSRSYDLIEAYKVVIRRYGVKAFYRFFKNSEL